MAESWEISRACAKPGLSQEEGFHKVRVGSKMTQLAEFLLAVPLSLSTHRWSRPHPRDEFGELGGEDASTSLLLSSLLLTA